jgi:hypothetical protein
LQQSQLKHKSVGSIPVLSPPQFTNAIILGLQCFSSLQQQHEKKKKKSMAAILAFLKQQ